MADDEKKETNIASQNANVKIPFTNVLEILANKVSRKATIIAMAMILIYLLAATPGVTEVILFTGAIAGLAIIFTLLQWIIDVKNDSKDKKGNKKNKDSEPEESGDGT